MSLKPVSGKIESQELNNNFSYLESRYESMDKGSPKGSFETLDELETAYPNGDDGIFVVNEDGNWYYWSDAGWSAGGVYQAKGISDYSVSPKKTTFLNVSKNLYHGNLTIGILQGSSTEYNGRFVEPSESSGRSCIIEIEPNQTYTITPYGGDRHRYAIFDAYPKIDDLPSKYLFADDGNLESFTFKNDKSRYLVIYLSLEGKDVKCQVEKGENATTYEQHYTFDGRNIKGESVSEDKVSFIKQSTKNLYHGTLTSGLLQGSSTEYNGRFRESEDGLAKSCIIKIEPNKTYTITPYGGDRHRYATFSEYPKFGDLPSVYLFADDGNMESFTFTNDDVGKYLVVYLSLQGEDVPCQVEEGDKATDYEPYYALDKKLLPNMGGEDMSKEKISDKYLVFEDLSTEYKASAQTSVAPGEPFDLWEVKHNDIYNLYDDLMGDYPEYITKVNWGEDDYDLPLSYYKFTPTRANTSSSGTGSVSPIKRIKIILTTGVHGNERLWPYSYYKLFRDICENYHQDKSLEFLRFNVDFVVLPMVNPSGFDDITRSNRNGVNINRNFSYNWRYTDEDYNSSGPEPFSEIETRFVKDVVDENEDAVILLDSHTFRGGVNILWAPMSSLNTEDDYTFLNNYMGHISRFWRNLYEWFPQDEDRIVGHINLSDTASVKSYGAEKGMISYTVEIFENIPYKPGHKDHDGTTIEFSMEYLANMIIGLIKSM